MATYKAVAIGQTGRGNFGHGLHQTFDENPQVRMVAVADPDEAGREKAKGECGAERGYADYREMLAAEKPEIVVVARHHYEPSRAEEFLAACESGAKGIYIEKPIASNLQVADRMMAAAEARGIKVVVAHRSRENPYLWWAREKVQSGEYGRLRLMRGQGKADRRAGAYDTVILGTHIFDQMLFFGGEVAWAWGRVTKDGQNATPADFFDGELGTGLLAGNGLDAYYAFKSGVGAMYESYPAGAGKNGNHWFGVDLYFERAVIALRNLPRSEVYVYSDGYTLPQPDLANWEPVHIPEWQHEGARSTAYSNLLIGQELVRCIEENRQPQRASSGRDAVAALEMILAPHESHRTKTNVPFPMQNREQPNEYGGVSVGVGSVPVRELLRASAR